MNHEKIPTPSLFKPDADPESRNLGWGGDGSDPRAFSGQDAAFAALGSHEMAPEQRTFAAYTGFPDGTFEVTVTIERDNAVATQAERGVGTDTAALNNAKHTAYERASSALEVLGQGNGGER